MNLENAATSVDCVLVDLMTSSASTARGEIEGTVVPDGKVEFLISCGPLLPEYMVFDHSSTRGMLRALSTAENGEQNIGKWKRSRWLKSAQENVRYLFVIATRCDRPP